ncbi:hypothetical protein Tco_0568022 [Tanacetum coccineum]
MRQGRSMGTCAPYARKEGFTPLTKTPKEILSIDNVNFPVPPPMNKIEEVMASGRLAHLVKDIRVRRIYVDGSSSSKIMYEHCFRNLDYWTRSRLKESRIPLVGFSGEVNYPFGVIDLEVTMGEHRRTQTVIMEFAVVKSPSSYNALLDPSPMHASSEATNPRALLAPVKTHSWRPRKEPLQLDDVEERRQLEKGRKPPKSSVEEKIVANDNYPEQLVTIGGEHRMDTYPHIEPKVQKKRSLAPDRKKVVTNEVNEWLKVGIVRRVRYPSWAANPVLVKKVDGSWRMCIDFKDLDKACPKDLYPLPEIDWKIESLMGFKYKCFLDAYKGYHQI